MILLIVLAEVATRYGELLPAFEAREMQSAERAVRTANEIAPRHAGVIAWTRDANLALGDYGHSEELYRNGDIPDLN